MVELEETNGPMVCLTTARCRRMSIVTSVFIAGRHPTALHAAGQCMTVMSLNTIVTFAEAVVVIAVVAAVQHVLNAVNDVLQCRGLVV